MGGEGGRSEETTMTPTIVPFLPILCQLGSIVIMCIINVCSVFIVEFLLFYKK